MALIWLSRSVTSAISVAAKTPPNQHEREDEGDVPEQVAHQRAASSVVGWAPGMNGRSYCQSPKNQNSAARSRVLLVVAGGGVGAGRNGIRCPTRLEKLATVAIVMVAAMNSSENQIGISGAHSIGSPPLMTEAR